MKIVLSSEEALLIEVFDLFWEFERKKILMALKNSNVLITFFVISI